MRFPLSLVGLVEPLRFALDALVAITNPAPIL
jgi:hypothetical protein